LAGDSAELLALVELGSGTVEGRQVRKRKGRERKGRMHHFISVLFLAFECFKCLHKGIEGVVFK
jgi:hypothetical protein